MEPRRELKRLRSLVVITAGAVIASACSSTPTIDDWEEDWRGATSQIPPIESILGADESELRSICDETVGQLRGVAPTIERAPNPDLALAAVAYVDFAEAVFFDCPIPSGQHAGFEAGYDEIDRLAAVVEALVTFEINR